VVPDEKTVHIHAVIFGSMLSKQLIWTSIRALVPTTPNKGGIAEKTCIRPNTPLRLPKLTINGPGTLPGRLLTSWLNLKAQLHPIVSLTLSKVGPQIMKVKPRGVLRIFLYCYASRMLKTATSYVNVDQSLSEGEKRLSINGIVQIETR